RASRGLVPLQLRDPRCARAVRGAGGRGASLGHRPPRGMAPPLGARGHRRHACDRQGPSGLPRGARVPGGAHVTSRLDRLRASLEEPLLVSTAANIRYLTGFSSSNATLLLAPDRVRLFSDFPYASAAQRLDAAKSV